MSERCEVVISGFSGRFPECESVNEFKQKLYNGGNFITEDDRKWSKNYRYRFGEVSIPYATGKFKNVNLYDSTVFAVSPVLANQMDIINRMVLEPSYEAILDAGINPTNLMGANVGCFMTCGISEIESVKMTTYAYSERLSLIGASKGMLSNRVSFALNLTGPSNTFYSTSGGLDALTFAYENLIHNRIDGAIVGASSNIVDPKLSLNFQLMGVLSPDGLSRVFDKQANGYVRSDGVTILYLQRAEDAKRSYGTLRMCDTLYRGIDAKSSIGIDEYYLRKVLESFYSTHQNVRPNEVCFVELDAKGVKDEDESMVNAVSKIFCNNRNDPLLIGSVVSSIGNTEGTVGYVAVAKACLTLDSGLIAPNSHFTAPNENIKSLVTGEIKVPTEVIQLPGTKVAVNSISMSGVVSHLVIEQNPKVKTEDDASDTLPRLLLVCGRVKPELTSIIEKIETEPLDKNFVAITNDIFKTPLPTHMYRAYTILPPPSTPINGVEVLEGENRPIWFVFSGMGSQWNGMGVDLLRIPIFAESVKKCDDVLRPLGIDIYHIISTDDHQIFDNIVHAFVGIITIQIGLVNILNALGIKPDGILGHSVGENACAYSDGCLTLEQAVLASYARGMASNEANTIKGMMAAIGRGYTQIKDSLPEDIEVACHNSVDNCTLTGPAEQVNEFVAQLQQQQIFAKAVNVSNIAYHSKHIRPAAPFLHERLSKAIPNPIERSSKWISTSVPEADWSMPMAKTCSAEYLTNNLISAVLFEEGCRHIPQNAIVLEIAPHGLLQSILKRSLRPTNTNISLTLRSNNSNRVNFLLGAIGKLFIAGCQPDVNALYPTVEYPVPRGTPNTSSIATWDHTRNWTTPGILDDKPLSQQILKVKLNKGCEYAFVKSHQIKDQHVIPPTLYMYLTWQILSIMKRVDISSTNIVFENVRVRKHLYVTTEKPRSLSFMILGSGNFEVLLENEKRPDAAKVIMTGTIDIPYDKVDVTQEENQLPVSKIKFKLNADDFRKKLADSGYNLYDCFDLIKAVEISDNECLGKITWNKNWVCFLDSVMKIYMYSQTTRPQLLSSSYIRYLAINPTTFELLNTGDEIVCKQDSATKKFWCNGLEMHCLQYEPLDTSFLPIGIIETKLQGMKFISHSNPKLQNPNTFIHFCFQLALDTLTTSHDSEEKLNIICTRNKDFSCMKEIINKNSLLKSRIQFCDINILTSAKYDKNSYYLVITNSIANFNKQYEQIKDKPNNLLVLVINAVECQNSTLCKKLFIEVTKQDFTNASLHLYKKLPSLDFLPPTMISDHQWPIKLASVLNTKSSQSIVILRPNIELNDLSFMFSSRNQYPNVRCLFILDDQAPKFSVENPFYKNQILQNLPYAVLKNGQWGSYKSSDDYILDSSPLSDVQLKDFNINAVHLRFFSYDSTAGRINRDTGIKEYNYGIEFSGLSETGKRIMGLGQYSPLVPLQKPDEFLCWSIPKTWSLEDATTVPLIYSQVYYSVIIIISGTEHSNNKVTSAFLNCDNMSFNEAFVAVCLYQNIDVYLTVDNESEAEWLMEKYPCLQKSHILDRQNCTYEWQLKLATKAEGVDLVINCVKDIQHVTATANCTLIFGTFIDLTDKQYDKDHQLGMYIFINSIAYISGPHNILTLLKLSPNIKKMIHDHVERGIKVGVVRPLSRTLVKSKLIPTSEPVEENSNVKTIYKYSSRDEVFQGNTRQKLHCDENHSFIIVGGGRKTKLWFDLIKWLIERGACKFVVALDNFSVDPKISHQINRLIVQKKATIVLTTTKKTETVAGVSNLVKEANNIAPLDTIFFVSLEPAGSVIDNFNNAFPRNAKPCQFISLFSGGLKEIERRQENIPILFVHADKFSQPLPVIFEQIDRLLDDSSTASPVFYQLVDRCRTKVPQKPSIDAQLKNFFTLDLQTLADIGSSATNQPEFFEVHTLCQRMSENKYKNPVFFIPARTVNCLNPVISKLLYPAFCATFIEKYTSIHEVVKRLYENLNKIQPHGPITIVGETWNGAIAIELAAMLQESQRKVELILIEGSPSSWQKFMEPLGAPHSSEFFNNLLSIIFREYETIAAEDVPQDLDAILNMYLNAIQCSSIEKQYICKAIYGIHQRLISMSTYNFDKEFLRHVTLFKQMPFESSMDKFSLSDDIFLFNTNTYEKFLQTPEISTIINDNALFSWSH